MVLRFEGWREALFRRMHGVDPMARRPVFERHLYGVVTLFEGGPHWQADPYLFVEERFEARALRYEKHPLDEVRRQLRGRPLLFCFLFDCHCYHPFLVPLVWIIDGPYGFFYAIGLPAEDLPSQPVKEGQKEEQWQVADEPSPEEESKHE